MKTVTAGDGKTTDPAACLSDSRQVIEFQREFSQLRERHAFIPDVAFEGGLSLSDWAR